MKKVKIIILGLTGSGKSTVADYLKNKGWKVVEVDDEVMKINNNVWPQKEDEIDEYFSQINDQILKRDNVIFVTSFLESDEIKRFYDSGFKIIEMHADMEELVRRKKLRDNIKGKKLDRFRKNYKLYMKIVKNNKDLISFSLDTTNISIAEMNSIIEKEIM